MVTVVLESVIIIINTIKIQVISHFTESSLATPQKNNSQKYNAAAELNNKYLHHVYTSQHKTASGTNDHPRLGKNINDWQIH